MLPRAALMLRLAVLVAVVALLTVSPSQAAQRFPQDVVMNGRAEFAKGVTITNENGTAATLFMDASGQLRVEFLDADGNMTARRALSYAPYPIDEMREVNVTAPDGTRYTWHLNYIGMSDDLENLACTVNDLQRAS